MRLFSSSRFSQEKSTGNLKIDHKNFPTILPLPINHDFPFRSTLIEESCLWSAFKSEISKFVKQVEELLLTFPRLLRLDICKYNFSIECYTSCSVDMHCRTNKKKIFELKIITQVRGDYFKPRNLICDWYKVDQILIMRSREMTDGARTMQVVSKKWGQYFSHKSDDKRQLGHM